MIINFFLLILLAVCVVTDLRKRKIYNKVIFPSLLAAIGLNIAIDGAGGLTESVVGFFAGISLLLIPYLLGGMGAGDVKLLGLIGALKGSGFALESFIYMAVIGALMAVAVIIARRGFYRSLGVGMPYGVAIAGGAVAALLMDGEFL